MIKLVLTEKGKVYAAKLKNIENTENTESIKLRAYAKINLTLEVLGKRPDGYHELRTLMQSVDIYDNVEIRRNFSGNVNVKCSTPLPENNTAFRAAQEFMRLTGCMGADIEIEKGIPEQAGMGGGSADAAAVLLAMEKLYGKIDKTALYGIARKIGADVPFCLAGGCALAEGVGERLTKLPSIPLWLLIAKGSRGVSTGELFHSLKLPAQSRNSAYAVEAVRNKDVKMLAENIDNALMETAGNAVHEINSLRSRMLECGALNACMTGSGSAVYGIFENREKAAEAEKHFSDCAFKKVCGTVPNGVKRI